MCRRCVVSVPALFPSTSVVHRAPSAPRVSLESLVLLAAAWWRSLPPSISDETCSMNPAEIKTWYISYIITANVQLVIGLRINVHIHRWSNFNSFHFNLD